MFGLIKKQNIINNLRAEINRNKQYKNVYKDTKMGAMYLGRELVLEEVIKNLEDGSKVNCDQTAYMIDWKESPKEKAFNDVILKLKEAQDSGCPEMAKNTVRHLLEKYYK